MADARYSDKIGVSEIQARYEEALRLIGRQDTQGRTIAISYFSWSGLQLAPLLLRSLFFLCLLALPLFQQPFAWLDPEGPFAALRQWQLFSPLSWILALLIYAVYFAVSLLRTSIYPGLPGAEIHFARHRQIIRTIKPGERALIFDARVRPHAVVSTKPIALEMPEVGGKTRDNISLTFRGALILRVRDTHRLLVEGGLEKFVAQLKRSYESTLKDLIIAVDAKDFNRFLIEPVATPQTRIEDVSKKLEQLGKTDLTIAFLTRLTEIDEVDVSTFDLSETPAPRRRVVLASLQPLANHYGIELLDHLPLGNTTSANYLSSLALPLANSITRLEQSTETLKEITEEEIIEEISANVADKQIGVLEIQKIIKEIASMTATLHDQDNAGAITQAKRTAMENIRQTILEPELAAIEALIAQVQAKLIDTAGLERYMSELNGLLDWVEREQAELVPRIEQVLVARFEAAALLPDLDVLGHLLTSTGTAQALERLRRQAEQMTDYGAVEAELQALEARAAAIRSEDAMQRIEFALSRITSDAGISTAAYSPEAVEARIDEIAREAELAPAEAGQS